MRQRANNVHSDSEFSFLIAAEILNICRGFETTNTKNLIFTLKIFKLLTTLNAINSKMIFFDRVLNLNWCAQTKCDNQNTLWAALRSHSLTFFYRYLIANRFSKCWLWSSPRACEISMLRLTNLSRCTRKHSRCM